ncbi:hypothetical protein HON52_03425 [Candidatus Uhrbacteria bacterium]|jgi:hypothetical protein|nr:hypothetical protein [Candidatus Uhrbacteria bacterium]
MFYVTALLAFLTLYFGISGFKNGDSDKKGLAFALLTATLGTLLITMFAFNALS